MTNLQQDETFMREALDLARRGRGRVEPNPMVGALIVCEGRVVARGWHKKYGEPHAEIMALRAARLTGADVRGCTMYVTLEPCSHFGKTPPCADALIEAKLGRVVVAMEDPDENVSGRGLRRLRESGIDVTSGVCQEEARALLQAYLKLRLQRRPWVTLKWAQTRDGFILLPPGSGRWISSQASREKVHKARGQCDGILVGINTVLFDDPLLTNRSAGGKQPVRVVLDTHLRIDVDCKLMGSVHVSPVLIVTGPDAATRQPAKAELLQKRGAEILPLPVSKGGIDLQALLDELGRRSWTYLLVEGGAQVHRGFLSAGLADELQVYVAPLQVDGPAGQLLPRLDLADLRKEYALPPGQSQPVGPDEFHQVVLAPR
jgi:diaminohydroxyphosphoribosylaminopyrimidine deaminase/5-amino-6-(5-phosphoribosylamino)uracil reductase